MIKLSLENYNKKKAEERKIVFQSEHYFEDENIFMLFFKSREKWEYYTIIPKLELLRFSEMSVDDFRMNYCSIAMKVEESPIDLYSNIGVDEINDDDMKKLLKSFEVIK